MDFGHIQEASGEQKLRAWAIEKSIERAAIAAGNDKTPQMRTIIANAKQLEAYVLGGA